MQSTSYEMPGWIKIPQAGIKIAGRNINNFRYTDDTTLLPESEEELKSLSMKVKGESEKVTLKLNFQKNEDYIETVRRGSLFMEKIVVHFALTDVLNPSLQYEISYGKLESRNWS